MNSNNNYGSIAITQVDHQASVEQRKTLRFIDKFGFSLGHIFNDIIGGLWSGYTLLFMQGVQLMPAQQAGAMLMIGQVIGAVTTPIAGLLTDKVSTKRKWHIIGTILNLLSFPTLYSICPYCDESSWWRFTYYTIAILVFHSSISIVQVAHLAMIPELSKSKRDRSDLTAMRQSATVISIIIVYVIAWVVFNSKAGGSDKISPSDAGHFREISFTLTVLGTIMSILFHVSLYFTNNYWKMPQDTQKSGDTEPLIDSTQEIIPEPINRTRKNFYRTLEFYQVGLLFVVARFFMQIATIYMPVWLNARADETKNSNENNMQNIATVPLVSFIASFIASILIKQANNFIGHKVGYIIGCLIGLIGCIWVAVDRTPAVFELYLIAICYGSCHAILMIASLSMTADMIGNQTEQGGMVYSVITFFAKLTIGVAVFIFQSMHHGDTYDYYRSVFSYACAVPALVGVATLLSLTLLKSSRTEQ